MRAEQGEAGARLGEERVPERGDDGELVAAGEEREEPRRRVQVGSRAARVEVLGEVRAVVEEEEAEEIQAAAERGEFGAAEGVGKEDLNEGVEAVEDRCRGDAEEEEGRDELVESLRVFHGPAEAVHSEESLDLLLHLQKVSNKNRIDAQTSSTRPRQ
jgi:hypothetical protein